MGPKGRKFRSGVTLVELSISMGIMTILATVVGILLVNGHRLWQQTYDSAHKEIKKDAQEITIRFGSTGRKSNRLGYIIYDVTGGIFTPTEPETPNPEEVISGDAVEFRYWDVELDSADSQDLLDVTKIATAYTLFYLDDGCLKVDDGTCPPGAVPDGGGGRNTSDITTTVIAENVITDPNIGAFSHTAINGVGQGCVRINIILTDPETNDSIKVMTATFLRNIWPR